MFEVLFGGSMVKRATGFAREWRDRLQRQAGTCARENIGVFCRGRRVHVFEVLLGGRRAVNAARHSPQVRHIHEPAPKCREI